MAPHDEFNVDTIDQSVRYLRVRTEVEVYFFELTYADERVVTVGTAASADIQLESPGVSPIHFYFERSEHDIWIVPAYCVSELRVNAVKITARRQLGCKSVIEFGNVQVVAEVSLLPSLATTSLACSNASARAELGLTRRVGQAVTILPRQAEPISANHTIESAILSQADTLFDSLRVKIPGRRRQGALTWLGWLAKRYPVRVCLAAIVMALAGSGAVVWATKSLLLATRGSWLDRPLPAIEIERLSNIIDRE
jgi:hypothetical protein